MWLSEWISPSTGRSFNIPKPRRILIIQITGLSANPAGIPPSHNAAHPQPLPGNFQNLINGNSPLPVPQQTDRTDLSGRSQSGIYFHTNLFINHTASPLSFSFIPCFHSSRVSIRPAFRSILHFDPESKILFRFFSVRRLYLCLYYISHFMRCKYRT